MATYSFLDTQATLIAPGGVAVPLGAGASVAEEGITITPLSEKSTLTEGADGHYVHNLHASTAARITVSLLRTSPTNAVLQQLYTAQTNLPVVHGRNILSVRSLFRGDSFTGEGVAFEKQPEIKYGKDTEVVEWAFVAGASQNIFGFSPP